MKVGRFTRFRSKALRIAQWRLICALGLEALHEIPGAPFRMWLQPTFRSVGSLAVYSLGLDYEEGLRMLPALLTAGQTFIDCGANQGVFALYAAHLVGPSGLVLAVEPQPYAVRAIRVSAARNSFQNLSVRQAAVSDRDGEAMFGVGYEPVSASLVRPEAANAIKVETVRLDRLLDDLGGRGPDFIKLDVEGAEEIALRGAERCLTEFHPHVLFECYDLHEPSVQGAYDRLAAQGYAFFLPESGLLTPLLDERRESFNILAVHPARHESVASLIRQG